MREGRRLDYTDTDGLVNEIPGAYYTGDGLIEQFLISNPLAGEYNLQLTGVGDDVLAGWATSTAESGYEGFLAAGDHQGFTITVEDISPALGDVNLDGVVNGLDVDPFVALVTGGTYQPQADMNGDLVVNGLDVDPFVAAVVDGAQPVPEPSALALVIMAMAGCVMVRRF